MCADPNTRSPKRLLGRMLAVAGLLLAAALSAAPVGALEVISGDGKHLRLEVSKGKLLRLSADAGTVFIANPEIADIQVKSPRLVYVLAKAPGETTLFAVDEDEQVLANASIVVTHNLSRLRRAIRDLHPEEEVVVSTIDGMLILDGVVSSAGTAANILRLAEKFAEAGSGSGDEPTGATDFSAVGSGGQAQSNESNPNIINRLVVMEPNQVNLRVRVVEMNRSIDKQLGFNWNILGDLGNLTLGIATFNPFNANVTTNFAAAGVSSGDSFIDILVDALETEGLLSVLAEPSLTAMSGETASFLAGGEFPILVPEGLDRITVEFKKFGVLLAFTPTVVGGSRISLHVRPEVSQLTSEGAVSVPFQNNQAITIPALTSRRAETTVEVASGQSFAIAGLLRNEVQHDISKFPGLGDVPILGALFRSDRFQSNETELVIIVTPYIVEPVTDVQLATPNDGFSPPHDAQRFYTGGTYRRNREQNRSRTMIRDAGGLAGPVGLQLD